MKPTASDAAWFDLAAIARYPAQSASLTTLVALAASMVLTIAPLVGFLVQLVIWAAAYRYAVEVFERTANGNAGAPEFATERDATGWSLLFLQLLFTACAWWLDARVASAPARWLGIATIALLQPAMTMTIAMNRAFAAALNPGRVLEVIARLGPPYLLLVSAGVGLGAVQHATTAMISAGRGYVLLVVGGIGLGDARQVGGMFAGSGLAAVLGQVVAGFVLFYAIVMYFHALGRVVLARQHALGFTPVPERPLRPEDRHAPLLGRVDALVAAGQHAAAAEELGRCLATEPHASAAMHARYRSLLATLGDDAGLVAHARMRLPALLVAGAERDALALLRDAMAREPSFRPDAAEHVSRLANAADRMGQHDLALALFGDFQQRHPRDPDIPANALAAARLLVDRRGDAAAAGAVLRAAAAISVGHPLHGELVQRLADADALARQVPGAPGASPR